MRISTVIAALALATLVGCGGGDDSDNKKSGPTPAEAAAQQVASWKRVANGYNALLQTCRVFPKQPGERGVVPKCTRTGRHAYAVETARLNQALAASLGSSPACQAAVTKTKALVAKATGQYARAYSYYAEAESAFEHKTKYKGPPVIPLLGRTHLMTQRNAKAADRLGATLRDSCAA
jgi:hypothetical protein